MIRIILIIIILLFPFVVLAHEGKVDFAIDPTALPGEQGYFWEKVGEWIDVNLLTLSTKQKQVKKLALAGERVAELLALLDQREVKNKNLQEASGRYEKTLLDAEYMAEKIIALDGNEIVIAENLEKATRLHEQVLSHALELTSQENRPIVLQSLNFARVKNEAIFKFMVKNYQANEVDIQKHRNILEEHIQLIEQLQKKFDISEVRVYLKEARKFQKAGLNVEAYDWVRKAKNIIYGEFLISS